MAKTDSKIDAALLAKMRAVHGKTINKAGLDAFGKNVYWLAATGGLKKIKRGIYSLTDVPADSVAVDTLSKNAPVEVVKELSDDEIRALIIERFEILEVITQSVISGDTRSVIVAGAPGVGKSYTFELALEKALNERKINKVETLKGKVSAIGLYTRLYQNREKGQVTVLDDVDIFDDEEAMNLLKAALDTSPKRKLSWLSQANWLKQEDIPTKFDYEGQIVFLTNINIEGIMNRGTRMGAHMGALVNRSIFLDLAIHTPAQIMVRVRQVLMETKMSENIGLSVDQALEALDWMQDNITNLRSLSLRTAIMLATFMKNKDTDWKKMARATLLKMNRSI